MKRARSFLELHHKRWDNFTLAEVQLLQQGLWIIGEQNRVDLNVMQDYRHLVAQLKVACSVQVSAPIASPSTEPPKCNRHDDCSKKPKGSDCCRDEGCDDCFGA